MIWYMMEWNSLYNIIQATLNKNNLLAQDVSLDWIEPNIKLYFKLKINSLFSGHDMFVVSDGFTIKCYPLRADV